MPITLKGDDPFAKLFLSPDTEQQANFAADMNKIVGSGAAAPDSPMMTGVDNPLFDMNDENVKRQDDPATQDGSMYNEKGQPKLLNAINPFMLLTKGPDGKAVVDPNYLDSLKVDPKVVESNQKVYEGSGQALIPGWEGGPRYTIGKSPDGTEQRVEIVPPPSFGPAERIASDVVLNTVAGAGELAGMAADAVNGNTAKRLYATFFPMSQENRDAILNATPDTAKAMREWIPTMAHPSDIERSVSEITSVVVGAMGGAGAGKALTELPAVERTVANMAMGFLSDAQKVDPANAMAKTQLFIKSMLIESASNAGATISTPVDAESWASGLSGGKLDNRVGTLIDNTVMSAGMHAILKLAGKTIKGVKSALNLDKPSPDERTLAVQVFNALDPDAASATPEEFVKRMKLFSDTVKEKVNLDLNTLGNLKRTSQRAVILGAREYVDEAYSFLKPNMGADAWEEFASKKAAYIQDSITNLRRSQLSSNVLQSLDGAALKKTGEDMASVSDNLMPQGGVGNAISNLVTPGLEKLNAGVKAANVAQRDVDALTLANDVANSPYGVLKQITDNAMDIMSRSPLAEQQLMDKFGARARQMHAESYKHYNELFDNLPEGPRFDTRRWVQLIHDLGTDESLAKAANLKTDVKTNPVADIGTAEDLQQLIDNVSGKSLKWAFNELRPFLRKQIDLAKTSGKGVDTGPYKEMISFIDDEAAKTGNPAFQEAMNAYRDHIEKYGDVEALAYLDQAGRKNLISNVDKGGTQLEIDWANHFNNLIEGGTKDLKALQATMSASGIAPSEIADTMIRRAVSKVASRLQGGEKNITALSIEDAFKPYLGFLEANDPEAAQQIMDVIDYARSANAGLAQGSDRLKTILDANKKLELQMGEQKLMDFMKKNPDSGMFEQSGGFNKQLGNIFNNVDDTKAFMKSVRATNDPDIEKAVQAQWLKLYGERFFRNPAATGAGNVTGDLVKESSSAVRNFLSESKDEARLAFNEVFANSPQTRDDFIMLLDEMNSDYEARMMRPNNASSATAIDQDYSRKKWLQAIIGATLGRLNNAATRATIGANIFNDIAASKSKIVAENILPKLLVDPSYLTDMLDAVTKNPSKKLVNRYVDELSTRSVGPSGGDFMKGVATQGKDEKKPFKLPAGYAGKFNANAATADAQNLFGG